ncbi:MAG: response regulator [Planctomycetes bacterium]|nr:response regulator [Planctomycetota bacterium]
MKLDEISPALLRKALDLYLERAYPGGAVPPRATVDTSALRSAADVLALFTRETRPNPGGDEFRHFVLRLGNVRYPHMKIAVMEFLERDEFMWSVDTHDRAPIEPGSPEWGKWQDLRLHNLRLKAKIETAWRKAGVPTARIVAKKLRPVTECGDGPLVLVVDDEKGLRAGAVNILRSGGYRVIEAESGLEAIEKFVSDRPDLVVVDYEMPGMSGEDVVRRLRDLEHDCAGGTEAPAHTPVLLATAGMVDLAEHCSADGFVVKPYQRTLLLSFVRHQLPGDKH